MRIQQPGSSATFSSVTVTPLCLPQPFTHIVFSDARTTILCTRYPPFNGTLLPLNFTILCTTGASRQCLFIYLDWPRTGDGYNTSARVVATATATGLLSLPFVVCIIFWLWLDYTRKLVMKKCSHLEVTWWDCNQISIYLKLVYHGFSFVSFDWSPEVSMWIHDLFILSTRCLVEDWCYRWVPDVQCVWLIGR